MDNLKQEFKEILNKCIKTLKFQTFHLLDFGSVALDANTRESDLDLVVAVVPVSWNENF